MTGQTGFSAACSAPPFQTGGEKCEPTRCGTGLRGHACRAPSPINPRQDRYPRALVPNFFVSCEEFLPSSLGPGWRGLPIFHWALGIAEERWFGCRGERIASDLVIPRLAEYTPAPGAGRGSQFDNNSGIAYRTARAPPYDPPAFLEAIALSVQSSACFKSASRAAAVGSKSAFCRYKRFK